jgi:hypothetical protein
MRTLALADEPFDASDKTLDHVAARLRVNHLHQNMRLLAQEIQEFFSSEGEAHPQLQEYARSVDATVQPLKQEGRQYFLRQPGRD